MWTGTDIGGCCVPRGRGIFEDPTRPAKQQQLGQELKELMNAEQTLDQLIQSCSQTFKHLTEDNANKKYPFCRELGKGVGAGLLAVEIYTQLISYLLSYPSSRGLSYLYFPQA